MKQLTIAIDIDDVLAANAEGFVAYSNKKWGTNLKPEDYQENWGEMWRISHEETVERGRVFHLAGVVGDYQDKPEAKPVLKHLSKRYKLVVITSRRKELIRETTEWIDKYFDTIFEEVHYAGLWDVFTKNSHLATKAELCREIGADYLIDDQLKHCLAAAEAGIDTVLFGDYRWNRMDVLPDGVTRACTWADVQEYFDNA